MQGPHHKPKMLLMDACVLIDYVKAERKLPGLISAHVGPVYVLSVILEEVRDIKNKDELHNLNLIIIEPEIEDAYLAFEKKSSISFQDRLCLLTAKRNNFICVTNDKELRRQCKRNNVEVLWGLQLIAELHKTGGISAESAIKTALTIHHNNPMQINKKIVTDFIEIISKQ